MSTGDVHRYRVEHRTTYRYGSAMTDGYTVACLVPRPTDRQRVIESHVWLEPVPSEQDSYLDVFGNLVYQFGLHEPHRQVTVAASSVVDLVELGQPTDDTPWECAVEMLDAATDDLAIETGFFRSASTFVDLVGLGDALRAIARRSFGAGRLIVDAAAALCTDIHDTFRFDAGFSDVSTPLHRVLAARRGVCQDFAHLAVGALRSIGLAARYVSGYIETDAAPGAERLVGADASHAWCSLWTPGAGWVDFDPTNAHLPVNRHITTAWGRDYADVTPVRGVMIGPATTQALDVAVDVAPL
ncbi:MAG TPA: transglutaminase family protein [Ilumatobacteraceae bacterium]|nr:transglutaminase family protein [Ilumatobacteraceae bacterium]